MISLSMGQTIWLSNKHLAEQQALNIRPVLRSGYRFLGGVIDSTKYEDDCRTILGTCLFVSHSRQADPRVLLIRDRKKNYLQVALQKWLMVWLWKLSIWCSPKVVEFSAFFWIWWCWSLWKCSMGCFWRRRSTSIGTYRSSRAAGYGNQGYGYGDGYGGNDGSYSNHVALYGAVGGRIGIAPISNIYGSGDGGDMEICSLVMVAIWEVIIEMPMEIQVTGMQVGELIRHKLLGTMVLRKRVDKLATVMEEPQLGRASQSDFDLGGSMDMQNNYSVLRVQT